MKRNVLKKCAGIALSASMILGMSGSAFAGESQSGVEVVDKSTLPRIIITTDLEVDDMNGVILSLM